MYNIEEKVAIHVLVHSVTYLRSCPVESQPLQKVETKEKKGRGQGARNREMRPRGGSDWVKRKQPPTHRIHSIATVFVLRGIYCGWP